MTKRCTYCANLAIEKLVEFTKEEYSGGTFPRKASYEHHRSLEDLETAASNGCDLCQLILECFKGSIREDNDGLMWPDRWEKSPPADEYTVYDEAKELSKTKVRMSIDTRNHPNDSVLEPGQVFDVLLVHVGKFLRPYVSDDEAEVDDDSSVGSWSSIVDELKLALTTSEGLSVRSHGLAHDESTFP